MGMDNKNQQNFCWFLLFLSPFLNQYLLYIVSFKNGGLSWFYEKEHYFVATWIRVLKR